MIDAYQINNVLHCGNFWFKRPYSKNATQKIVSNDFFLKKLLYRKWNFQIVF